MKRQILFFILIFYCSASFSQILKGRVVDEQNQPLPGANIYFDGTQIATIADANGDFTLQYKTQINSTLAISFIGYQTTYLTTFNEKEPLKIVLKESVNSLKEVIIKKNRFSRKQMLKLFREQFLGTSKIAKKAKILNEDDLYFNYDEKNRILKVASYQPLVIDNVALDYTLTYELVDFYAKFLNLSISSAEVYESFYLGTSRFEEVKTNDKINKKRKESYLGSQLHFFRNLATNQWNKENFLLFVGAYQDNPENHFQVTKENDFIKVKVKKQQKPLSINNLVAEFNVLYDKKKQSRITFLTDTFYIDQMGNNSHIESILFSGAISKQKVADLVPLNFKVD
jgi:hypothetical protein